MSHLHVIEERKAGSWTFYRLAKDADDAAKGVAAMRLANPAWEVRAAEYVRAKDLWLDVEIQNGAGTWVAVECAYTDEAELLTAEAFARAVDELSAAIQRACEDYLEDFETSETERTT